MKDDTYYYMMKTGKYLPDLIFNHGFNGSLNYEIRTKNYVLIENCSGKWFRYIFKDGEIIKIESFRGEVLL